MAFEKDRDSLVELMRSIYHWVEDSHNYDRVSHHPVWPTVRPLFFLHEQAHTAWNEFQETNPLDRFIDALNEAHEDRLTEVGLFGGQLKYKLDLLHYLAHQALIGKRRAMEKFTEFLEIILDSLLELMGFGESIKELIGALKAQIR